MDRLVKNYHLSFFIFLSVLLLNFSPVKPLSYPLTLAPFAVFYLLAKFSNLNKISSWQSVVLIAVPVIVIIISFLDIVSGKVEVFNFLRTYCLWLFYFTCLVLCFCDLNTSNISEQVESLAKSCTKALLAISTLVVFQVFYYRLTGDISIFSFWGDFSYGAQGYTLKAIEFGATKANGPYLEPSTLGLVNFCLLSIIIILGVKLTYLIPVIVIALLSGSAAAMGSIIILLGILSFKKSEPLAKWKNLESIIRLGTVSFLTFLVFVMGPYLATRIGDVLIEGTSTHYRLIAPLQVIYDVFLDHPFGITFGLMEDTLLNYGMLNGLNEGTSLDNGWYLLMFYFGWSGLLLFLICFSTSIMVCVKGSREFAALAVYLMLSPFFTGAVFSPEFLFLQMLVFFSYKLKVKNEP